MRIHPFTHAKFLPYKELMSFEHSDRILVGKHVFEMVQGEIKDRILISLTNSIGQSIAGTLYGYHMEENILYVPSWMFYSLDITNNISLSVIHKVPCNKITVRPHNNEFLSVRDWNEQLGAGVHNYTSITEGTVIPVLIAGTIQKFTIVGMYPFKHKTCILQADAVLELNIVKSLELVKQEVTLKYLYNKHQNSMSRAFECIGHTLGGTPAPSNITQRQLLLDAAKSRTENQMQQ